MAIHTTIRTPFRRPCLLRAEVEANVDAPEGRRSASAPYATEGAAGGCGGSGPPDYRTIHVDLPSRIAPRCSGVRKGNVGSPPQSEKLSSKQDNRRALQAFGLFGGMSDLGTIPIRGSSRNASESPEKPKRVMVEELQGVPLAGAGADIDNKAFRRGDGSCSPRKGSRTPTSRETKTELFHSCITHQFRRRHYSLPPDTRSCSSRGDFDHRVRAEDYAELIGRPEGNIRRRGSSCESTRRSRSQPPFHVEHRDLKGALFERDPVSMHTNSVFPRSAVDEGKSNQSTDLIAALQEATDMAPTDEMLDSMLQALESPSLRRQETEPSSILEDPSFIISKSRPKDASFETPNRLSSGHKTSAVADISGLDDSLTSTTAAYSELASKALGRSSSMYSTPVLTGTPSTPSQRQRPQTSRSKQDRAAAELWKAKRRASWVG